MKRPPTHVIGDAGVKGVAKYFVTQGWACDPVLSDYGEDLIVQTTLNGTVDPFRTLVQVRSSKNVSIKKGQLACRISREHALRWARCAESVLLVLWDANKDRGWYAFPAEQFSEYDLLLSDKNSVLVRFNPSASLTKMEGSKLGWVLRLDYFRKRMLSADERDRSHFIASTEGLHTDHKYQSKLAVVVFEFLRLVGIITPRGISAQIRRMFLNAKRNLARDYYEPPLSSEDREEVERNASMLILIGHVNDVTGVGIPTVVAEIGASYLLFLLKRRSGKVA